MIIVFDTETNGLPKDYKAPVEDVDNYPRIIQLAWNIYSEDGNLITKQSHLIKPDGWKLPTKEDFLLQGKSEQDAEKHASFWPDKGYTMERLNDEGKPLNDIIGLFIMDRLESKYAVAHNMSFDGRIIRCEMIRSGIKVEFTAKKFCTMQKTVSFCNLPNKNGKGKKYPTLSELYKTLFNSNFEGAHDAGNDVDACAKCFFELKKLGIIKLE